MGLRSVLLIAGLGFLSNVGSAVAGSVCAQPWNNDSSLPGGLNMTIACPNGWAIPKVDVTIPNNPTMIDWICVVYGILPFVVIGLASAESLVRACCRGGLGTRECCFLTFVLIEVVLGELFFKKLVQRARPELSCAHTCGMPSSHATMSIGYITLVFLDAVRRVMPSYPTDLATAQKYQRSLGNRQELCCGYSLKDFLLSMPNFINFIPLSGAHTLSPYSLICMVVYWSILLLPVGFTRVALNDHSPAQVTMGAIIGFVEAVLFFALIRQCVQKRFNHLVGQRICGVFIHNYALPVFESIGNSYSLLASCEDGDVLEDDMVEQLMNVRKEVRWYLKQSSSDVPALMLDKQTHAEQKERDSLERLDLAVLDKLKALGHDGGLDDDESEEE